MVQISSQLEAHLCYSLEQYREIICLMQSLSNVSKISDNEMQAIAVNLGVKQEQAQQHDADLIKLLRDVAQSISDHPLYLQRKALLEEVLELNHLLLPKINGMMALISHELNGLKNGRAVLGGYKQTTHKQGRLVKSSV